MKSASASLPTRYHPVLVTLHWLTVVLLFGAVLFVPEEEYRSSPVDIHMIFGVLLAVVLVARLVTRFSTKRPAWATTGHDLLDKFGELVHYALYFFAFVILTGGALIAYRNGLIGWLFGSGLPTGDFGEGGRFIFGAFHVLGWFATFLLILLHVGAALYHQFILKDNLLSRMWYGK